MEIPGHSPIPKALFWARKALEDDSFPLRDNVTLILSAMENEERGRMLFIEAMCTMSRSVVLWKGMSGSTLEGWSQI
eukprot:scaffold11482_cov103-Skeletonema_marinoi.AAC.5